MNEQRRLIGSFTHGSMANALLARRSARRSRIPDRQVVALAGDGGLAMMLGELLTLTQNRAAGEDDRGEQLVAELRRARDEGRRLRELRHRPRQPELRGDRRGDGHLRASGRAQRGPRRTPCARCSPTTDQRCSTSSPSDRSCRCRRRSSAAQVKGFALYAIRTVMSGRGDELLDLARANWRQLF